MKKTYLVPQTEIDEISSKYLCDAIQTGSESEEPIPDAKEDIDFGSEDGTSKVNSIWG